VITNAVQRMTMPRATGLAPGGGESLSITLAHAERHRRRGLLATDTGEEIMLDLPHVSALEEGAALVLSDGRHVAIRAAVEPLAEVRAPGGTLARLAWHVGNRHTPAEIGEGRLLIRRDPVLEAMLAGLGAEIKHVNSRFHPEGGAYGHGRTHSHD